MSFQLKETEIQLRGTIFFPSLEQKNSRSNKFEVTLGLTDKSEIQKYQDFLKKLSTMYNTNQVPYVSGDQKANNYNMKYPEQSGKYDFVKNHVLVAARTFFQPAVLSIPKGFRRIEPSEVNPGDTAIVTINVYYQKDYRRLCAGLGNIAIINHTTLPLAGGGQRKVEDEFASFKAQYGQQIDTAMKNNNTAGQGFGFNAPTQPQQPTNTQPTNTPPPQYTQPNYNQNAQDTNQKNGFYPADNDDIPFFDSQETA